jgi:hypothetical protein
MHACSLDVWMQWVRHGWMAQGMALRLSGSRRNSDSQGANITVMNQTKGSHRAYQYYKTYFIAVQGVLKVALPKYSVDYQKMSNVH